LAVVIVLAMLCCAAAFRPALAAQDDVYQTYGVHNAPSVSPCQAADCRYPRQPGEPADPLYPPYWSSSWTMYRVFGADYASYPPPYAGQPPAGLKPGTDYETSYGATYYDSTWTGASGQGAMMEQYDKRCLPIFPINNQFSCAFISLGDVAYFVTYPQDRPPGMPPVCLFSPSNHPPRRDFVSHLPYSAGDSQRLGPGAQGYSFWVAVTNGKVLQAGASPVLSPDNAILFGYAFAPGMGAPVTGEPVDGGALQPSSFYFSGYPYPPTPAPGGPTYFAPFVSQNYTGWTATQPDPAKTWALVSGLDVKTLPACQLFDPPTSPAAAGLTAPRKAGPTWADIGRGKQP
jgi:hypothetical protein